MPVDLPAYMRDRLVFFERRGREDGPVARCRLVGDGYLLTEPEDVRHVLVQAGANYVKSRRLTGPRARYPAAGSVLSAAGMEHRRRRRAIQNAFRRPLVDAVTERTRANAERLAACWSEGDEVEIGGALTALAQRNLLEALVGPVSDARLEAFAAAVLGRRRAIERIFVSISPYPEYVPTAANLAYVRGTRRLASGFAADIAQRRREPGDDLLSLLVAARYDDGEAMSDREVLRDALMLALTGYDNVSEALIWTLYLLAGDPESDARVAAEAQSGGEAYTTRVVRESLRAYPPTWMFVRIALAGDTLPSGARIPRSAKVYVSPYVIQRDPRHWPEPDRFSPERFDHERENGRPRYAYFPFGGGPHVCIGETLAVAQVVTVLAAIAQRHRLALVPGQAVLPEAGLKLRPKGGLRMVVEPRLP